MTSPDLRQLMRELSEGPQPVRIDPGAVARLARQRQRRRRAGATTAVAVGLLAGAVALHPWSSPRALVTRIDSAAPSTSAAPIYVGTRWLLSAVTHDGQSVEVPASSGASVEFGSDGRVQLYDGINPASGRYTLTATGFTTQDVAVGGAGYAGTDPVTRLVIDATAALLTGAPDGASSSAGPQVAARMDGGLLILAANSYQLTFHAAGSTITPAAAQTPSTDVDPARTGVAASSPTGTVSTGSPPTSARCTARQLTAAIARTGALMNQPFAVITLTNRSTNPCTMSGYPQIAAYTTATGTSGGLSITTRHESTYEVPDPGPQLTELAQGASGWFAIGTSTAYDGGKYLVGIQHLDLSLAGGAIPITVLLGASGPQGGPVPVTVTAFAGGPPPSP